YLAKMIDFSRVIPDNAGKQVFAEKVAGFLGITSGEVLPQLRKSFVAGHAVASSAVSTFGDLKKAEKDLIWSLIHDTPNALEALEDADLEGLVGQPILELARRLRTEPRDALPVLLLERLNVEKARVVREIATNPGAPAFPPAQCVQALKRHRLERERTALKMEIDRLQRLGATDHGGEIDALSERLLAVAVKLDRDITGARD